MLPIQTFCLALILALVGCSDQPGLNIDAEPALAVLGGAVLATQNSGIIAAVPKEKTPWEKVWKFLQPIPEAFAAVPICPAVTTGVCNGSTLSVFYNNCSSTGFESAGGWRSNFSYTFPTPADCTNVQTNGFDAIGVAALVGKTITRGWGLGTNGDQQNIRLALNGETTYMYSDFPSGWQDNRVGGATITFVSPTVRQIVIQGVHAKGIAYASLPDVSQAFDLMTLAADSAAGEGKYHWDHTINTVKTGDSLFQSGPQIIQNPDTTISFSGQQNNTVALFDGDIFVTSGTVARGAALRIQHNMSFSLGVLVVTEPLVYSDPSCCWPSSGTVKVEYDRNLVSPELDETVVFTGGACGEIKHTTSLVTNQSRTLSHCF